MRAKVYDQLRAGYEAESRKLAESLLKEGPKHLAAAFVLENTDRLMKGELWSEANNLYFKQLAKTRKLKKTLKRVADAVVEYYEKTCGLKCEDCKVDGIEPCNVGKLYAEVKKAMEAVK